MLGSTSAVHRAGWLGAAPAIAALLGMSGCGPVVAVDLGTGGATSTGSAASTGTGGATTGTGITTSSTGVTTTSSTGSGAACNPACGFKLTCCDGACVETDNDLLHCGGCGGVCPGAHPYCRQGVCQAGPPCTDPTPCPSADFCCGTQCCDPGEICCDTYGGPPQANPHCEKPQNGTCQKSCFACN